MSDTERWWQAYLAALTGMHAYGQSDESYSIAGADRAAAQAAGLALTRWRAIGAQAESSGETAAALPEMCAGCVHSAKRAAEEPCASCVSGSGRGADCDAAEAHVRELEGQLALVDGRRSAASARATAAERERDEARAEIVARSESVMRQAETITGLRAKLAEEEMVSESWRIRIAAAVGAVHEWDYGSAPGTWEQIEDKAESDRKQADATLDEMIVYRDKCETLESRLTRYAALESAAMKLCKSSTDAEWQALSAALDALSAPAPKPEQGGD